MNEYFSRSEISPIDRVVTRAPAAVAPVQGATAKLPESATASRAAALVAASRESASSSTVKDEAAGAAEYASVHARIADILADLRSDATASVDGAASEIQSMVPAPIILVPLPPASKDAVEHAALLAKRMADQASFAHAAQAHLRHGTVDQILSTVA
jgi:hypothetical protein